MCTVKGLYIGNRVTVGYVLGVGLYAGTHGDKTEDMYTNGNLV